jgi:hypothetical protein
MDEIVWAVNPKHDTCPAWWTTSASTRKSILRLDNIRFRLDRPEELPDYPLSSDERHNLFLAAKEALNNVVKHAAAAEVWLRVRLAEGQVEIAIEDNGRGFDINAIDSDRHGLTNMEQRLAAINGRFDIVSQPGAGSKARFFLSGRPGCGLEMAGEVTLKPRVCAFETDHCLGY